MRTLLILILTLGTALGCSRGTDGEPIRFYVASSDPELEYSIFLSELDPETLAFSVLDSFAGASGPSYLALSPGKDFLYCIDKTVSDDSSGYQQVSAFSVDPETRALRYLNSQSSQGTGPCHVFCDPGGGFLFTANYNSGSVAAFPLGADGKILPACGVMQSSGSGPVEDRQEGPHTHQVTLDPGGNILLSPDLGSDRILLFAFDRGSGLLSPNPNQPFLQLGPGAGPRHLVFQPDGDFVCVVNELNATLTVCSYDRETATLILLHSLSTVEPGHQGSRYPAAVRISPDGRFVYASTRGENSVLTVFAVEENGGIRRAQVVEGVPFWPRDFNIDPSGRYLLVAGERSNDIALYTVDQASGELSGMEARLMLPSPGCILFADP